MEPDVEKYKYLYEFQKDQFDDGRKRFQRLEDKAFKFLTSLTVASSAYLLLVRSIYKNIEPSCDFLSVSVMISIVVTFLGACSAWSFIFRAMRLQTLVTLNSGPEMIAAFDKNKRASLYRQLACKYSEGTKTINEEYHKKLNYVRKAYDEVAFTGWSFLVSVILIFTYLWSK